MLIIDFHSVELSDLRWYNKKEEQLICFNYFLKCCNEFDWPHTKKTFLNNTKKFLLGGHICYSYKSNLNEKKNITETTCASLKFEHYQCLSVISKGEQNGHVAGYFGPSKIPHLTCFKNSFHDF